VTAGRQHGVLALPFVLLFTLSFAAHWTGNSHAIGNLCGAAFVGCILTVPPLSRQKLWLGYAALLYPFVLIGLFVALDWGSLSIGWD